MSQTTNQPYPLDQCNFVASIGIREVSIWVKNNYAMDFNKVLTNLNDYLGNEPFVLVSPVEIINDHNLDHEQVKEYLKRFLKTHHFLGGRFHLYRN